MNHFFLVGLPGFEDLILTEAKQWAPETEFKIEKGGVSFQAPREVGVALNRVLKTPTRILVRVESFRCRDFPALFKFISNHPWRHWIDPTCELSVKVSTHGSRLKIQDRIAKTALEAWAAYQKRGPHQPNPEKPMGLFIRLVDDECTVSLDTSGETLHKRGRRESIGDAPLRETIAAGLLQWMGQSSQAQKVELIDPMMGSGVFLLEAAIHNERIDSREFSFSLFKLRDLPNMSFHGLPRNFQLCGFEVDAKAFKAAERNLAGIEGCDLRMQDGIQGVEARKSNAELETWVICNPPYGERLKIKGALSDYYEKLLLACQKNFSPRLACFIFPEKATKIKCPNGWRESARRPFQNGGIPVCAVLYESF